MFGSIGAFISQIYETVKLETFRFVDWPSISFDQQRVERLKRQVDEYSYQSVALFPTVKTIIEQIKQKTEKANENNRSRTNAYLTFFSRHPEVHWALLAHIVSRNYGWRMTDLQGSLLHPFLSFEQKEAFYLFFEQANSVIFQDAYPQLLLFEESLKHGKPLFHLLPSLGVSRFMIPFWEDFFQTEDSKIVTTALLINEQYRLESTMANYRQRITSALADSPYIIEQFLSRPFILVPFATKKVPRTVVGMRMNEWTEVAERIQQNRTLYALIFGLPRHRESYEWFAKSFKPSGSREDMWPHLFSSDKRAVLQQGHRSLVKGKPFLHSPTLSQAWGERKKAVRDSESDWYKKEAFLHFGEVTPPDTFVQTEKFATFIDLLFLISRIGSD
ncbi:DUF2515 domain-containing protein [Halalkalibacterium halodurans]|uniref:DUF2515 family protein n=1 Tax=Halalkalibacterium halodurans TaxID=86665 RepID=UPI0010683BF8|nr:DUF2515 family protein [Halalkalibacterium halodurans]TES54587.1 DUF2515 domain-containing protein [Halalkalibacterium halodurans]